MMARLRRALHGLLALVGRRRSDSNLDEEFRAFVDASAEAKMRAGLDPDRARREARLELGGPIAIRERVRDAGWDTHVATWGRDARYGLRVMRRTPIVTAAAVLSLALGIGANTTIFTLLDAVVFRQLPVDRPGQLRQVALRSPRASQPNPSFSNPLWEALRDRQQVFAGLFAWGARQMDLSDGGEAHDADVLMTSGAYFPTLGVHPAAGRLLMPSDDVRGCPAVAVLSYAFWQDRFGGAPAAIGGTVSLDRHRIPIVGVAARGFTGLNVGSKFDVALPVCAVQVFDGAASPLDQRSWWWLTVVGRVPPGAIDEMTAAKLAGTSRAVTAAAVPLNWKPDRQREFQTRTLVALPAASGPSTVRRRYTEPLETLLVIAALVLLIACANIAALMLARAAARRRELAVRLAIGASRGRLIRQLVTESLMLSLGGAAVGLVLAHWGGALLVALLSTWRSPIFVDLTPDPIVLIFTTALAVATGLLFGLWPAVRATRVAPSADMKGGTFDGRAGRRHVRPGQWIAAVQIALSLTLLVVSGLFLRSFVKLTSVDLGFDASRVLVATAISRADQPKTDPAMLFDEIEGRLAALPGVQSVSRSLLTPMNGAQWDNGIIVEGPHVQGADIDSLLNAVSPGYFKTLHIPLLAGRDLDAHDTAASPQIAVVNDAFARRFFPGASPVGRRFHVDPPPGEPAASIEIVGLVGDSRYGDLREEFPPAAYFPLAQRGPSPAAVDFQIRAAGTDPEALAPSVAAAVGAVRGSISLRFHTLDQYVDGTMPQERLLAVLSSFFGGLALLLAGVGLYGVLAYAVSQRRKETGIRLALGATPGRVVGLVVRDVATLLGAGLCAGTLVGAIATRFVKTLLFDLAPTDPATFAIAAAALALAGMTAAYGPARRAAKTDPITTLRQD